jgi:hypothetical protein
MTLQKAGEIEKDKINVLEEAKGIREFWKFLERVYDVKTDLTTLKEVKASMILNALKEFEKTLQE